MINLTTKDYENIVVKNIKLIDVRAPVEFNKGAFINSVNLPLMNDEERHLVGICYQEHGNEAAVALGHQLVSGMIKEQRVNAWKNHLFSNPDSILYCYRGGQRSLISQQWIKQSTGIDVVRLEEGYKGFRNYLIEQLNPDLLECKPLILSGYTGSGKTELLNQLENSIDLEGIANHRGSSFGHRETPQPTQISFENNLAYAFIRHRHQRFRYMILEDEGKNVGSCFLPIPLVQFLNGCDLVLLEVPLEERIEAILKEYVIKAQSHHGKNLQAWAEEIRNNLLRIRRRLGGERHQLILNQFNDAYEHQKDSGDIKLHEKWIESLLNEYYDPMYRFMLQQASSRIIFKGDRQTVFSYLKGKATHHNT
ncbi:MAG: tRNA 2-selenouridine(34) synthase MnmH [Clostridia bacterium]|nr:tRNA 2-selenouridine(34) synthase MnmH [Clostridia bacterium]